METEIQKRLIDTDLNGPFFNFEFHSLDLFRSEKLKWKRNFQRSESAHF